MHDVARAAGVSHQTVSRVINGHQSVRQETREKVQSAIDSLGYRRNSAARALKTRRSGTIGVLTTASSLYGPVSTLIAVEDALRAKGLFVGVAGLRPNERPDAAIEHFMGQAVEGIVVIAPQVEVATSMIDIGAKVPVVMVSASSSAPARGFHTTSVDQVAGAQLATRHLVELGHRRILHVAGPQDWFDASARLRGYRAEIRKAGLKAPPVLAGDWTSERGYQIGVQLAAAELPDAIFVANDLMALGLVRALSEAGIDVPGDVSVVGFDDIDGAAFYRPPLTTVRQDFDALGRQCVQILLGLLGGAAVAPPPIVPEFVMRASTAAARPVA